LIAYFDTSAIIPLIIDEAGTDVARQLWDQARRVVTVPLLYAEGRAALAQAQRMGRVTRSQLRVAVDRLDDRYSQLDLVGVDEALVHDAGELAEAHGLRGYDAMHLAAARQAAGNDFVVVAGDRALLGAAQAVGLTVAAVG